MRRQEREAYIEKVIEHLKTKLRAARIKADIQGRPNISTVFIKKNAGTRKGIR